MAKQGSLKGPGTTGNKGASLTGVRHKVTSKSMSGESVLDGRRNIATDGQGRSSSTLQGAKVFRTRPSASSGDIGEAASLKGKVPRAHTDYDTKLIGDVYKSTKSKRK